MKIKKGISETIILPAALRPSGTNTSPKSVKVTATGDISIQIISKGSCSAYLILPIDRLGQEYYILTWWDPGAPAGSAIINIAAVREENTSIRLTFPDQFQSSFVYNGDLIGAGSVLTMTLMQFESYSLTLPTDLSGIHIKADGPVVVLAGNNKTYIGYDSIIADNVVEQMTPVDTWGTKFAVLPTPYHQGGYAKLITKEPNTTISLGNRHYFIITDSGSFTQVEIPANSYQYIEANKQIMVVYYLKGDSSAPAQIAPAALLVPPFEQFLDWYPLSTLDTMESYMNYVVVVIDQRHTKGLELDGVPVNVTDWNEVAGTSPLMVGRHMMIRSGSHRLQHAHNVTFGAYMFGIGSGDCAYAFPGGMSLLNITMVSLCVNTSGINKQVVLNITNVLILFLFYNYGQVEVLISKNMCTGECYFNFFCSPPPGE